MMRCRLQTDSLLRGQALSLRQAPLANSASPLSPPSRPQRLRNLRYHKSSTQHHHAENLPRRTETEIANHLEARRLNLPRRAHVMTSAIPQMDPGPQQ